LRFAAACALARAAALAFAAAFALRTSRDDDGVVRPEELAAGDVNVIVAGAEVAEFESTALDAQPLTNKPATASMQNHNRRDIVASLLTTDVGDVPIGG
jgi:hypothetical protein